jgi:hypothetical protein
VDCKGYARLLLEPLWLGKERESLSLKELCYVGIRISSFYILSFICHK